MKRGWPSLGVPLLIVVVGAGGAYWLAGQDRARQITTREATTPAPPMAVTPAPADQPQPQPPPLPPGAVIRSLDRLNAAAAAVGCPTIAPGDPAARLIDLAECLGDKAVARRATGDRAK